MNTFAESTAQPRTIGIAIDVPIYAVFEGNEVVSLMIERIVGGALRQQALLTQAPPSLENEFTFWRRKGNVVTIGSKTIGMFCVTHFGEALKVVQSEIEAIGLLKFTHIAWCDSREGVWRMHYPAGTDTLFTDRLAWLKKWRAQVDAQQNQEKGSSPSA